MVFPDYANWYNNWSFFIGNRVFLKQKLRLQFKLNWNEIIGFYNIH